MATISRGAFITRGTVGGLALMAGRSPLAVAAGPALGQAGGDADIATLAATAELLAVDFYGRAIRSGVFTDDVLAYLEAARQNERDHYDALAQVLGTAAPTRLRFRYPAGSFGSAATIAGTGAALETALVGAYIGAVESLADDDLRSSAALIAANEAQHLTTLKRLEAGNRLVPGPSFPEAISARQAMAAVTPFLA